MREKTLIMQQEYQTYIEAGKATRLYFYSPQWLKKIILLGLQIFF